MKRKSDTANTSRTVGSLDAILALLAKAVHEPLVRKAAVSEVQSLIWDGRESVVGPDVYDVLADLAVDLDYYEADPIIRMEDASFYGMSVWKRGLEPPFEGLRLLASKSQTIRRPPANKVQSHGVDFEKVFYRAQWH